MQPLLTLWYRLSHRAFAIAWRVVRPTTIGAKLIATGPRGDVLLVKPRYQDAWTLPIARTRTRDQWPPAPDAPAGPCHTRP